MKLNKKIDHLLRQIQTRLLTRKARANRKKSSRPLKNQPLQLVLLISRSHDIDLYLDIYLQALSTPSIETRFWATKRALNAFPATKKLLAAHKLTIDFTLEHKNLGESLERLKKVDVLLNTVESSIAAHKIPHRLTKIANASGCLTFTLQHAFENIGLTVFDSNPDTKLTFAARWILTWGATETLSEKLAPETRQKCIAVGCPKMHLQKTANKAAHTGKKPIISIFEGLHAARFDKLYRENFFRDLQSAADKFREFRFVLKPHPGVREREIWHIKGLKELKNIDIIDPGQKQTDIPQATPELLALSLAAITTPSTIALDAALSGTPVAVVRYQQKSFYSNLYQPLPIFDKSDDWFHFLETVGQNREELKTKTATFLNRVMLPGSAAERVIKTILDKSQGT